MEILGIGPSELIFIVILALIVLGPKDMQKAGLTIGKFLRKIITSEGWEVFQKLSHQVRTWPNRMMREANEDLNMIGNELNNATSGRREKPRNRYNTPSRPKDPEAPAHSRPFPDTHISAAPPEIVVSPQNETDPTSNESDQQQDA